MIYACVRALTAFVCPKWKVTAMEKIAWKTWFWRLVYRNLQKEPRPYLCDTRILNLLLMRRYVCHTVVDYLNEAAGSYSKSK